MNGLAKALPIIGFVIGPLTLIGGAYAARFVVRSTNRALRSDGFRIRIAVILLGLASAVLVSCIKYYPNPDTMVYGFPFLSFIFQKGGGQWLDFMGPLTIPALVANAAAGFLLPFIVTAFLLRPDRR